MDGANNLMKKQVSCRDDSLLDGLQLENIADFENMGNIVQDLCNDELHGEGSYTSKDGVQGSACESSSNSKSKKGNEDDIGEGDKEVWVQENSERHEKGNQQANGCRHDDAEYDDGMKGKNSNVVRKQRFEWRGIECDIVDDNEVFVAKGWVVACDPHKIILDD